MTIKKINNATKIKSLQNNNNSIKTNIEWLNIKKYTENKHFVAYS